VNPVKAFDITLLISICGLAITIFQLLNQLRSQQIESEEKRQKEYEESATERTKILETLKFVGKRLDRMESWINANSGFKGS
jgi:hypothetical protein